MDEIKRSLIPQDAKLRQAMDELDEWLERHADLIDAIRPNDETGWIEFKS